MENEFKHCQHGINEYSVVALKINEGKVRQWFEALKVVTQMCMMKSGVANPVQTDEIIQVYPKLRSD